MRRRALIMAVLLVAPLAVLGGSRRPVFLLRPSPGLRKSNRVSIPQTPFPAFGEGGFFISSVAGSCGEGWLPQLLPPGRRPLALSCGRGRSSLVHRGFSCLRHQSGSVPTAKRANRGHIAARFPPCCLRAQRQSRVATLSLRSTSTTWNKCKLSSRLQ